MGGGTAAMLTMMLREKVPPLAGAEACAIACPACMTLQLAASCAPFVTTLVHGCDIVPTFSTGAIDALRQEVRDAGRHVAFSVLSALARCTHSLHPEECEPSTYVSHTFRDRVLLSHQVFTVAQSPAH